MVEKPTNGQGSAGRPRASEVRTSVAPFQRERCREQSSVRSFPARKCAGRQGDSANGGRSGTVALVGAGPGDPDLITVRGVQCLREADTVVYDYLANPALLALAANADERIYVGKKAGCHAMTQDKINALLIAKSREGRRTVRLKGGDPFVFGRGGEEALALAKAGIPFEVVPGITAGIAAPAYAGIPVTHRTYNSVLTFVTGHEDPTKAQTAIDWRALASGGGTLVIYMGVRNLPGIVDRLLVNGRSGETPAALIHRGTGPGQRVVHGTLSNIVARVKGADVGPPAVIVIGDVVAFREHLRWFDVRPLYGKTVLVTRSRSQTSEFARQLQHAGAEVVQLPTIRIEPPDDWGALREAVKMLQLFDWILFTSVNGVESFFEALTGTGGDSRSLGPCRVAAIGSATAEALLSRGISADLVPERFTSDALFDVFRKANQIQGCRFLLPRSDIAPLELARRLTAAGGHVTCVTAYRTVPAAPEPDVLTRIRDGQVDLVTFTSSSTVRNFVAMMREYAGGVHDRMEYASIGPETSRAARACGLQIAVEADIHTIPGLVQALVARFGAEPETMSAPGHARAPGGDELRDGGDGVA